MRTCRHEWFIGQFAKGQCNEGEEETDCEEEECVKYEQHGLDRAKYGSLLLSTLARDLTPRRELAYAIEAEEGRHVARQSAKRKGGGK